MVGRVESGGKEVVGLNRCLAGGMSVWGGSTHVGLDVSNCSLN